MGGKGKEQPQRRVKNMNKNILWSFMLMALSVTLAACNAAIPAVMPDRPTNATASVIGEQEAVKLALVFLEERNLTDQIILESLRIVEKEGCWLVWFIKADPSVRPRSIWVEIKKSTGNTRLVPLK